MNMMPVLRLSGAHAFARELAYLYDRGLASYGERQAHLCPIGIVLQPLAAPSLYDRESSICECIHGLYIYG